jgi:hypothetical protein
MQVNLLTGMLLPQRQGWKNLGMARSDRLMTTPRRHNRTTSDDLFSKLTALLNCKRALAVVVLTLLAPLASGVGTEDLEIRDIILTTGIPSAYARTPSQVLVLNDTGEQWIRLAGEYSAVAVDPISPNRVLLVSSGEVFVSTDRGATRTGVSVPDSINQVEFSRDGTRVYATAATASYQHAHLYRSRNSGVNWTRGADIFSYSMRFPAGAIYVNPWDADRVIVTVGPIASAITGNGGDDWRTLKLGDTYGFAFSPPGTSGIWAATSSGLHLSTDSGLSWTHSVTGHFYKVWIDPNDTSVIYALEGGAALYRSNDGGAQFTRINAPAGIIQVNVLAFDPLVIGRVFMGAMNGIWTSVDAGATWSPYNREIYEPPAPAPAPAPGASGNKSGGGTFSWSMLLALASVGISRRLLIRRRRS